MQPYGDGLKLPYTKKPCSLTLVLDSLMLSVLESWIGKKWVNTICVGFVLLFQSVAKGST